MLHKLGALFFDKIIGADSSLPLISNGNNVPPVVTNSGSRYYFSRLTSEQRSIYDTLLFGIERMNKEIKIPLKSMNELSTIFNGIVLDNPMLFYISSGFNFLSDPHNKKCIFKPEYKYARSQIVGYAVNINQYLQAFDNVKNRSEYEKEIFVHDFCLNNFCYDNTFQDCSHTVLGLVLNKTAVCEGIAKFVKLAFDYLGMKSLVVTGKANDPTRGAGMEDHAWNIIKIGGKTYHLDVTFDMTMSSGKTNRYDYFNLSDEDIKKDHVVSGNVPVCATIGGDYYSVNSMVVRSLAEFEGYVDKLLWRGNNNMLVKILNVPYNGSIVNQVMDIALRKYCDMYKCSAAVDVGYNASQMVFEIRFK